MKNNKYNWDAEDYAKHSSAQHDWARELISKLKLNGTESILDIGCGDGKITAEIADQLPSGKILGVDSSAEMVNLAQEKFPQSNHSNLSFRPMDARNLQFKEEFDIVFSNAALHWIKNHLQVISGIKESLKPKGRMLLQMGGKGNAASIISILETMILEENWNKYFCDFKFPYGFHDPSNYKLWLQEAGFNAIRTDLIPKDMIYEERKGLAGWIRTTWLPYTSRVPEDLKTKFITELVEKYIQKHPLDDMGRIHVKMIRLEVEALKI